MIDIQIALAAAEQDAALARELAGLVNRVYADAEAGLWVDGTERTTPAQMAGLIVGGQIALASAEDQIVGAVRI
ncbi:MAG TPA: hypothetical protein VJT16_02345, partial [Streptosporangiaceae bacterium]|nr:hypothetical protein [Streptosporangiaceae bacterium]